MDKFADKVVNPLENQRSNTEHGSQVPQSQEELEIESDKYSEVVREAIRSAKYPRRVPGIKEFASTLVEAFTDK